MNKGLPQVLHQSKPVIASAAKQSIFACPSCTDGSPRRCAPRDDGLIQTFPHAPSRQARGCTLHVPARQARGCTLHAPARQARGCTLHAPARQARGFTLIEVLVALTIVAVALMAGMKASGALTLHAQRQTDVLLGQMCVENALHQMRLSRQMPGVGQSSRECQQGTQTYTVALDVQPTPNPNFVRVDALVRNTTEPVLRLTTIVGRN
jgi:general secretion pathway protein I